jgi:hypothetical protein
MKEYLKYLWLASPILSAVRNLVDDVKLWKIQLPFPANSSRITYGFDNKGRCCLLSINMHEESKDGHRLRFHKFSDKKLKGTFSVHIQRRMAATVYTTKGEDISLYLFKAKPTMIWYLVIVSDIGKYFDYRELGARGFLSAEHQFNKLLRELLGE